MEEPGKRPKGAFFSEGKRNVRGACNSRGSKKGTSARNPDQARNAKGDYLPAGLELLGGLRGKVFCEREISCRPERYS